MSLLRRPYNGLMPLPDLYPEYSMVIDFIEVNARNFEWTANGLRNRKDGAHPISVMAWLHTGRTMPPVTWLFECGFDARDIWDLMNAIDRRPHTVDSALTVTFLEGVVQ